MINRIAKITVNIASQRFIYSPFIGQNSWSSFWSYQGKRNLFQLHHAYDQSSIGHVTRIDKPLGWRSTATPILQPPHDVDKLGFEQ